MAVVVVVQAARTALTHQLTAEGAEGSPHVYTFLAPLGHVRYSVRGAAHTQEEAEAAPEACVALITLPEARHHVPRRHDLCTLSNTVAARGEGAGRGEARVTLCHREIVPRGASLRSPAP